MRPPPLLLAAILLLAAGGGTAAAWQVQGRDGPEPSLWAYGDSPLANPDPNAHPLLRRALALLSLQCRDGEPAAFLNHNFAVEAPRATVALQLDDGPALEQSWAADSAISLHPPDGPRAFAARLLGHRRLRLTITWPGAAPSATTFAVAGLDRAMAPLRAACGW